MKRLLCCCVALLMVFSFFCNPNNNSLVNATCNDADSVSAADVADIWITLRDSGKIRIDVNGYFYVVENAYCDSPGYSQFLVLIDQCNMSISEGIIVATESCSVALSEEIIVDWEQALNDTCAYYTTSLGIQDEVPQNSTYVIPGGVIDDAEQPVIDNGGSTHSCSAQEVDMIVICEANYQFILKYYESMMIVQMTDPTFNAWLSAVSLWVSKVRENGDWDYKVSDMFGPYNNPLCAYYDGSYHHITAEYFGNFNYGYTGSLLFGLDILHFGSYAVSGFDAADETDWPAIDDGYYYKTEG